MKRKPPMASHLIDAWVAEKLAAHGVDPARVSGTRLTEMRRILGKQAERAARLDVDRHDRKSEFQLRHEADWGKLSDQVIWALTQDRKKGVKGKSHSSKGRSRKDKRRDGPTSAFARALSNKRKTS